MPVKQVFVNDKDYLLSYAPEHEARLDELIALVNARVAPYAERFDGYGESYLLLLALLDMANQLEEAKDQSRPPPDASLSVLEDRLKKLVLRTESLVKKTKIS